MDRAAIYQFSANYRCQGDSLMASHQHLVPNLLCFDISVSLFGNHKKIVYFEWSYSDILSGIIFGIYSAILSYILFGILFHILCDILFGILFGILSDIYSDILTFYLTYILTFYLASIWQVGKNIWLVKVFFWGGYYKIKAVNFAPNITGVCKHIFGISHQATFWRLQKRYRATGSKLFLDAVDMWGLWTCAMFCWYHPTHSHTIWLCHFTHVMSLSRFVDDSNRRRSHGKPPFRTPESRGVIITFWKAHGVLSHPLSIFPMSGDILGDWHEWDTNGLTQSWKMVIQWFMLKETMVVCTPKYICSIL